MDLNETTKELLVVEVFLTEEWDNSEFKGHSVLVGTPSCGPHQQRTG